MASSDHLQNQVYWAARREHAWRLRKDGRTWREIGQRMGISYTAAAVLVHKHERMLLEAAPPFNAAN